LLTIWELWFKIQAMVVTLILILAIVVFLASFVGFNLGNICQSFWFFKTYTNIPVIVLVFIAFAAGIVLSLLCVFFAKLRKASDEAEEVDYKKQEKLKKAELKAKTAEEKAKKLQEKKAEAEEKKNEKADKLAEKQAEKHSDKKEDKKVKNEDPNKTQEMSTADLQKM